MTEQLADQDKAIKAKLIVKLFAENIIVAESDDEKLWQSVLAAITSGKSSIAGPAFPPKLLQPGESNAISEQDLSSPIGKFAAELGISIEILQGACSPTAQAPFVHLDGHYWESFKKAVPARGRGSLGPLALPATLLCLWFKHLGQGGATQAQAQAVLKTINERDQNPNRSVKNCDWLQARDGKIVLNPAQTSKAVKCARTYCLGQQVTDEAT
ncbi:MAG: hypothetical protein HY562_10360 [Ignavibacteriales bacterium]|nr:hypothetical protein [Ignavibacteriales bacterium]